MSYFVSFFAKEKSQQPAWLLAFSLVRKMGLEPTRIKCYMREMQYLSGFFVLFSCTKGIKNTLSE